MLSCSWEYFGHWTTGRGLLTDIQWPMLKSTQNSITPVRPIKKKLMNDCQPTVDAEREGQNDEPEEGTVMPWAVLSQMNRMHESQEDKLWRRIKPILSIFKALRPINQTRFLTALWWTSSRVGAELVMFKFMMTVIMIKTPPKEIGIFEGIKMRIEQEILWWVLPPIPVGGVSVILGDKFGKLGRIYS